MKPLRQIDNINIYHRFSYNDNNKIEEKLPHDIIMDDGRNGTEREREKKRIDENLNELKTRRWPVSADDGK